MSRLRPFLSSLLSLLLLVSISCSRLVSRASAASDGVEFPQCNCDDGGGGGGGGVLSWSLETILECQRVSDFLIAVAYFSIPLELLYFISFSSLPFKWVFLQFVAFIVLCGLTHLLNAWTYYGPHSFHLVLSLTVAKFLTALVSCATAITLLTLIPLLLKVKVRELFLRQNVLELDQEVGIMKKQKEASWHVRMLTREIRKSLDKHTILYTTLVELSNTLRLRNCAVWLPDEARARMTLFHELCPPGRDRSRRRSVPADDPGVLDVLGNDGVREISPGSALGDAAGGAGAAVRMPILRVSNFKGGTPERVDAWYAILVLVLPGEEGAGAAPARAWTRHEMEMVEVVADQVAVALSHADVLEESQAMREKLAEQNRDLQAAKRSATMASQARVTFQKVMSHGMRRPMHSISGLLSVLREDEGTADQRIVVDTMLKACGVLSTLIDDVMEISARDGGGGRLAMQARPFELRSTVKEAACLVKCLCMYRGLEFEADVQSSLPNRVVGDEKRAFQVILHMAGHLLSIVGGGGGGTAVFRVAAERGGSEGDLVSGGWRAGLVDDFVSVKFEFEIRRGDSRSLGSASEADFCGWRYDSNEGKEGLSFDICKRLVQMMQGNIWISPNPQGFPRSMTLVLRFQIRPSFGRGGFFPGSSIDQPRSNPNFKGLQVILADDDDVNRTVTKKLLEKLGCDVLAVSSGFECLSAVTAAENCYRVVLLDIHMPEMDGFEVALRIRKFRSRSWPLIIAVTASAEEHVWERCLQMGMNGLIRKPVVLKVLAEELQRVLQRAGDGL